MHCKKKISTSFFKIMNYLYTDMFISFYEPVKLSLNVPIRHSHNLKKLN